MASYTRDVERLARDLEKLGLLVRLTSNGRYRVQLPNGNSFQMSVTNDPAAYDQQRKLVIESGLHWPLDPKPRARKAPIPAKPKVTSQSQPATETKMAQVSNTMTEMVVTPDIAAELLEKNTSNRKISDGTVQKYARAMRDGAWHYDASPIKFDTNDRLLDGQHRLWAVIESGTSQKFLVVRGLDPRSFTTMDTGKRRGFADVLTIEYPGINQPTHHAAITAMLYRWTNGARGNSLAPRRGMEQRADDLLEFYRENREVISNLTLAARRVADRTRGVVATTIALCMWVFDDLDAEDSEYFFEHLVSGAGLEEGSPILALRNYFSRQYETHNGRNVPGDIAVAVIIKAWNAYREGRQIKVLAYKPGGANPEAFPVAI